MRTEQVTHTQGPWEARTLKNDNVVVFANSPQLGSLGICHILFTNGQPHENARLIAAAPDMLAELKDLSERVRSAGQAGCFENWGPAYDRARAAIAKAEGRAP